MIPLEAKMHRNNKRFVALLLGIFLPMVMADLTKAQNPVRVIIGVQVKSGKNFFWTRTNNRLKAGDSLRVYVIPASEAYIYVVHTDRKNVTLLNDKTASTRTQKDSLLILPSTNAYYRIDGASEIEQFTIVCSPTERTDIVKLFGAHEISYSSWTALEKPLLERSKIDLNEVSEKPFTLAGNVRAIGKDSLAAAKLKTFTGDSLLVKRYEFSVEK